MFIPKYKYWKNVLEKIDKICQTSHQIIEFCSDNIFPLEASHQTVN